MRGKKYICIQVMWMYSSIRFIFLCLFQLVANFFTSKKKICILRIIEEGTMENTHFLLTKQILWLLTVESSREQALILES